MSDITISAKALHCPACGALVGKDDDRCRYCGASLIGVVGGLEVATPQMARAVAEGLSYYDVLNVAPNATRDQIEDAYNLLLERYVFNLPAGAIEEATRKVELLKQAYQVLSDPDKRATYDTVLKFGQRYAPDASQDSWRDGPEVLAHGKGLLKIKLYADAAVVFAKARQLMPESAEAHYGYAVSRLEQEGGDIFGVAAHTCQLVMHEATTALALDPCLTDAEAYKALAQALYLKQNEQADEARTWVVEAIRHKPDWALAYHVLAGLAFQAGEMDLAEKACRQALKLDPDNANVKFILDNVHRRKQEMEQEEHG